MVRRVLSLCALTALLVAGTGNAADAHQPVFVDSTDSTAKTGPLLVDGTISFAVYGKFDAAGQQRWVRAKLKKGDPLLVELLLPNQDPEVGLPAEAIPVVTVRAPDGRRTTVPTIARRTFDEPFSGTSYVFVSALRGTAKAGTYEIGVRSRGPARFTLVVGQREVRGVVEGESPRSANALFDWWQPS